MNATWYPLFDFYRIIFSLWVVFIHLNEFARLDLQRPEFHPVAAFVCLSGFLIPRALRRSDSYRRFAWKRACRVLPAFFASLLLVLVLPGWGLDAVAASLLTYVTLALIYPSFAPANGPLWSLALEEWLYGFHAATHRIVWVPGVLLGVCALWALTHPWSQLTNIFFVTAFFFLGNLIERADLKAPVGIWLLGLVCAFAFGAELRAIGEAALSFIQPGLGAQFARFVTTGLACICLIGIGVTWRPAVRIPDLSYGVYIYHFPLALWGLGPGGWTLWQVLSATLGLAVASWYLIEAPALKLKNWQPRRHRRGERFAAVVRVDTER